MQIQKYPNAIGRWLPTEIGRQVIMVRGRYYTGNHESIPISEKLGNLPMWTRNWRKALIYADVDLLHQDVMAIRQGELPEGRQGVKGKPEKPNPCDSPFDL